MGWLVRDGEVLAAVEIADTARSRRRGLIGPRRLRGRAGAAPLPPRAHRGYAVPLDVAFCDTEGIVLRTTTLAPWRISPIVRRAAFVIEAEAGAFDRWRLARGDRLELRA